MLNVILDYPKRFWQKRIDRWLTKRIPDDHQFKMDMSNIFIFPSKFGMWFLVLAFMLFILGSNYRNNLMLLLSFFLVSLFLVTLMSSFANFARLKVQLGRINPVFAGEDVALPLWLSNSNNSADNTKLPEGKLHFRVWGQPAHLSIDSAQQSNPVNLSLPTTTRGMHRIPRISIETYFPLGLYRCWTHLRFTALLVVYPTPIACEIQPLTNASLNEDGVSNQTHTGTDDFDSLKTYVTGEPLHRIAWKQVAKGQGLVSKQFAGNTPQVFWLSTSLFKRDDMETALSKLCYQVLHLSKKNMHFGLALGDKRIAPGTGEKHTEQCLLALAQYGQVVQRYE